MLIGYIRVSTGEQNTARQDVLMKQLEVQKIYIDKQSGKNTNRPQLKAMLEFAREGDTIVIESYSRLARSTADLLKIVEQLKEKNINLISKKENIDTNTPQGKLMLTLFGGLYEFERECMLQRQAEGIAIAKVQGKYRGRQPINVDEDLFKQVYDKWKASEITARQAMQELNLKPNTFYRRVKEYEDKN